MMTVNVLSLRQVTYIVFVSFPTLFRNTLNNPLMAKDWVDIVWSIANQKQVFTTITPTTKVSMKELK